MLINSTEKSELSTMDWHNQSHEAFGSEWSQLMCYQILGFPISLLGVIGNIMSIHIWTQKDMQWGMSSTSWYLVALSCSDILYLLTLNFGLLLPDWKKLNRNGEIESMFEKSETVERLRSIAQPMSDTFVNISIYLVVAFTFERFLAVTYPIRGRVICTPQRARYIILMLIAVVVVLQIPGFLEHDPTMKEKGYDQHKWFRIGYNWGVMVLFFAVLPLLLLSFFNSMLIRQVHLSRKQQRKLTSMHKNRKGTDRASEKFIVVTMTVILIVIIFFICHTPAAVILCIWTYQDQFELLDRNASPIWSIASSAANLLSVINSSVNFLLYSIFSSKFRQTLRKKYCSWWCGKPSSASTFSQPTYMTTSTRHHNKDTENGTNLPLIDNTKSTENINKKRG